MNRHCSCLLACLGQLLLASPAIAQPRVVISEIMYHPVEEPAFNTDGTPVLDLSEDIHEYIELHNIGSNTVSLAGWQLTGGMQFAFPTNAVITAGQYLVVAKDPVRLAAVPAYGLKPAELFGPWLGKLDNDGESIKLKDVDDETVDAVSYSPQFPWPISANALGADDEWTGLKKTNFQYRGRSLERVSFTHPANDPANWLASPAPGDPSPGKPNAVQRAVPKPVVVSLSVAQVADGQPIIRNNQSVRLDCQFSATKNLSNVTLEYFLDDVAVTGETLTTLGMSSTGNPADGRFTVTLTGQPDRTIVRYRIRANRGEGVEVVSPRADDPFAWHAYFVTPVRTSSRPVYDVFISATSLSKMNSNISQSPRRVTSPDPPGYPRASWNATEPGVFVHDGVVYDIQIRYHGSRYNRSAGRQSYKIFFPAYRPFNGKTSIFETDKNDQTVAGHAVFAAAGLPTSFTRYVDFYLNNNSRLTRLEQEEYDVEMLERYHREQHLLNPGSPLEEPGEIYKSVGTIDTDGEGPYGRGDGVLLRPKSPYWAPLQRYEWTYSLQDHGWKGHTGFTKMIDAMWAARADQPSSPNPNLPALRAFFEQHFDVDKTLTYLAVLNWMGPWDDTTQNHFLWQQSNGKWTMLPWDFDAMLDGGGSAVDASIFAGEVDDRSNNFRGPNYFKDSFIKAFRLELAERNFLLIHTLLHPENITALGFGQYRSFAEQRYTSVHQQCGIAAFERPDKPANLSPQSGRSIVPPMSLQTSAYGHSATPATPHASTTWLIRSASGSYTAPLFKLTTTSNLISLPIPFDQLIFGETYYWRALHTDVNNHPSLASDETAFTFGQIAGQPTTNVVSLVAINATTLWKYDLSAADLGTAWRGENFDDSTWKSGPPLLALENAALPAPIRTPLALTNAAGKRVITYYFRRRFNFSGEVTTGLKLRLNHVIDDGVAIFLNGNELLRTGMDSGALSAGTFASRTVGDAVFEGPFDVGAGSLLVGDNLLAVEVHQANTNSSDVVFGVALEGLVPVAPTLADVVLNEIMADNRATLANSGKYPDWIELYNASDQPARLVGLSLSDDVLEPEKFIFPGNTVIPPHGYLLVWCDNELNAPGLHTGFALDAAGQTIALFAPSTNGTIVKDTVTFGLQIPDHSIGRSPDGSGGWRLNAPTPGAANQPAALGSEANLKINEWIANPASGDDWFELYNPGALPVALGGSLITDNMRAPTNTQIATLSFLGAGGFVKFQADEKTDQGANHAGFKLSSSGDAIILLATDRTVIDSVSFGVQETGVSQGHLPDGAATIVSFPTTDSPGESNYLPLTNVIINEVLTHTDPPLEDAIELYNPTTQPVAIGGWFLSNTADNFKKLRIPDSTVIPSGGFKVFYEAQFNPNPGSPTSFTLNSAHGDEVHLAAADLAGNLSGFRTHVKFGAAEKGVSFGRYVTKVGADFTVLSGRTFGADAPGTTLVDFRGGGGLPNAVPLVGPVVINEIIFHPPDVLVGTNLTDNVTDEFIELHNVTTNPVLLYHSEYPLNTWRLRDAVDFEFPINTVIPASGFALVVSFDPVTNSIAAAAFRSRYSLTTSFVLFGPYRGKLDNSGESVELLRPDAPQLPPHLDAGFVPYILVDKVGYADAKPWPAGDDGTGNSLQRRNAGAYGNDPVNWSSAPPTPGRGNLTSQLVFESAEFSNSLGNILKLRFTAEAGRTYCVEYRESLTTGTWQKLKEVAAQSVSESIEIADENAGQSSSRYYRLVMPQTP